MNRLYQDYKHRAKQQPSWSKLSIAGTMTAICSISSMHRRRAISLNTTATGHRHSQHGTAIMANIYDVLLILLRGA